MAPLFAKELTYPFFRSMTQLIFVPSILAILVCWGIEIFLCKKHDIVPFWIPGIALIVSEFFYILFFSWLQDAGTSDYVIYLLNKQGNTTLWCILILAVLINLWPIALAFFRVNKDHFLFRPPAEITGLRLLESILSLAVFCLVFHKINSAIGENGLLRFLLNE